MGMTIGAALKKILAVTLADPKVLKNLLFSLLVVLVAVLLPVAMVVALFSGEFTVDTDSLQEYVETNLSAEDIRFLRSVENIMESIENAMTDLQYL